MGSAVVHSGEGMDGVCCGTAYSGEGQFWESSQEEQGRKTTAQAMRFISEHYSNASVLYLSKEVQEDSEENVSMWHRDCLCDILAKNEFAFCPCWGCVPEAKVENLELILLAEKTSKQPSTDSVVWLLVFTLMKIL